jgi:hypothetical protein
LFDQPRHVKALLSMVRGVRSDSLHQVDEFAGHIVKRMLQLASLQHSPASAARSLRNVNFPPLKGKLPVQAPRSAPFPNRKESAPWAS